MSLNSQDNQLEKIQKSGAALQGQGKANQAKLGNKGEKAKGEKARKEKIKKAYKDRQKCQKSSISATESNAKPFTRKKQKNLSQITYFNCNKKGHYSTEYTEPKAKN